MRAVIFSPYSDCHRKERVALDARKKTWVKLTRPVLRGNITQTLCEAAELADVEDYKAAGSRMYELLLLNTELLDFYPGLLQRPEAASDAEGQLQVGPLLQTRKL